MNTHHGNQPLRVDLRNSHQAAVQWESRPAMARCTQLVQLDLHVQKEGQGSRSHSRELDLQVTVVMLVCNFERTTIFVSALSNPLSTSAKVIDSTVCVRLCSHAVGGRQGIHKQHRATF